MRGNSAGKFPDILRDPVIGEAATNLYADAQRMLATLVEEKWLRARAVVGFFPANSVDDDDIDIYADETRGVPSLRLHHLRQQKSKPQDQAQLCLADFVAPAHSGPGGLSPARSRSPPVSASTNMSRGSKRPTTTMAASC